MMSDLMTMMWTAQTLFSLLTVWAAIMRNDYVVPLIGSSVAGAMVLFASGFTHIPGDGVFFLWSVGMFFTFALMMLLEGWNN
jgi:hypothetical protein